MFVSFDYCFTISYELVSGQVQLSIREVMF